MATRRGTAWMSIHPGRESPCIEIVRPLQHGVHVAAQGLAQLRSTAVRRSLRQQQKRQEALAGAGMRVGGMLSSASICADRDHFCKSGRTMRWHVDRGLDCCQR